MKRSKQRFFLKWRIFFVLALALPVYYIIFINPRVSGDLGVMSRIPFGQDYDKEVLCPVPIVEQACRLVDVDSAASYHYLLIGDSYTEPSVGLGHSMGEAFGDTVGVVNCYTPHMHDPLSVLWYGLVNDRFHPGQTIILETVERMVYGRSRQADFSRSGRPEMKSVAEYSAIQSDQEKKLQKKLAAKGLRLNVNLNDVLTWIRTRMGYKNAVIQVDLTQDMFANERYADKLFYFKDDSFAVGLTDDQIQATAACYERMLSMAKAKGVRLYVMVIPDKSDLYYPYMINPKADRANVLEFILRLPTSCQEQVINVRDILAPHLANGEKDIFRLNDSHWSYKASGIVAREVARKVEADEAEEK